MEIREIKHNKSSYMPLLLLADESEVMISKYLEKGRMFILEDNDSLVGEVLVTDEGNGILEIKNIAVYPEYAKRGYGRALIKYIENKFKNEYSIIQVGTGESPLTVPFYKRCGFTYSHRMENFFLDNYDHPIYECGVLLKDMVYFRKKISS